MTGAARLGDLAKVDADGHGCPACPHPGVGPAIIGSTNVQHNNRPAIRMMDTGTHAACCGGNTWQAVSGSTTVFINGKPAVRVGDLTKHCSKSVGQIIVGSSNVLVG